MVPILMQTERVPLSTTPANHIFPARRKLLSCFCYKIQCLSLTLSGDEPEFTTIIARRSLPPSGTHIYSAASCPSSARLGLHSTVAMNEDLRF